MSASRERKKRQEFVASGGTDPKAAREAERKAKERKSNILYGSIGVVFVLVAAFLVIYNSGVLQRNATAVTIDGENYSAADYSYYYNTVRRYYTLQYGSYADMLVSADQIQEQTLEQMRFIQAALARAEEEGFTQIAAQMRGVAAIEKEHEERYLALLKNIEQAQVFSRVGEQVWVCRNCGHVHVGPSAPVVCPVCAHPQAFFELKATNY